MTQQANFTAVQRSIIAVLRERGGWVTAAELRDVVAPGTSLANNRVQIFRLREHHSDRLGILSEVGGSARGYRLVRNLPAASPG